MIHNLCLSFPLQYFSHRIIFHARGGKMTEFPGKAQTNSPHPLVLLVLAWSHPKPGEKKASLPVNSLPQIHCQDCQLYWRFPCAWSPWGFLKAEESEDFLKVPTGAGWKFQIGSECSLEDVILYHCSPFKEQPCAQVHVSRPSIPDRVLSKPLLHALYLWQGPRPENASYLKEVRMEELLHRHWHWKISCKPWKQQCRPCMYGCSGSCSNISLLISRNVSLHRGSLHESWCHLSPLHTGKKFLPGRSMWGHRERGVTCFCCNQMSFSKAEAHEDPLNNSSYSSDKQNVSNWNLKSWT